MNNSVRSHYPSSISIDGKFYKTASGTWYRRSEKGTLTRISQEEIDAADVMAKELIRQEVESKAQVPNEQRVS